MLSSLPACGWITEFPLPPDQLHPAPIHADRGGVWLFFGRLHLFALLLGNCFFRAVFPGG